MPQGVEVQVLSIAPASAEGYGWQASLYGGKASAQKNLGGKEVKSKEPLKRGFLYLERGRWISSSDSHSRQRSALPRM